MRPGDVAAVPEPQTYAMLLLGLSGVLVAVKKKAATLTIRGFGCFDALGSWWAVPLNAATF